LRNQKKGKPVAIWQNLLRKAVAQKRVVLLVMMMHVKRWRQKADNREKEGASVIMEAKVVLRTLESSSK
jgi:hypothetical protein